ncbi:hypothetical protein N9M16_03215 [Candidatus Dependentiae bacterium]|nr:hypothetical protein [Candidatus Dependentiae bacterium]
MYHARRSSTLNSKAERCAGAGVATVAGALSLWVGTRAFFSNTPSADS